jgi:hypothetical protein
VTAQRLGETKPLSHHSTLEPINARDLEFISRGVDVSRLQSMTPKDYQPVGETMVGLEGSAASLAKMAARFASPRLTVIDDGNDTGYMKSSDIPSSDDALIIELANRLVKIVNGIMSLSELHFQPVAVRSTIVREDDDGNQTHRIYSSDVAVISTAETATVVELLPDGTTRVITPVSPEPPQPALADIALDFSGEKAVVDALGHFAYRDNWAVNLYKVYEIVGLDVGKTKRGRKGTSSDFLDQFIQQGWAEIAKRGWVTSVDAARFRETMNSSEALGDQARHQVQSKLPPANPMYEPEAKRFIGVVLEKWLRKKYEDCI